MSRLNLHFCTNCMLKEAIKCYFKLGKRNPMDFEAYMLRIKILMEKSWEQGAIKCFTNEHITAKINEPPPHWCKDPRSKMKWWI